MLLQGTSIRLVVFFDDANGTWFASTAETKASALPLKESRDILSSIARVDLMSSPFTRKMVAFDSFLRSCAGLALSGTDAGAYRQLHLAVLGAAGVPLGNDSAAVAAWLGPAPGPNE
jgi:hypothetical protein